MLRSMWTIGLTALLLVLTASSASAALNDILITEVVDGTLPGGLPKWIEIWNAGGSAYTFNDGEGIALLSNGANDTTTDVNLGEPGNAVTLQPGDVFVLTNDQAEFNTVYGFDADWESGNINGNGDDVYAICDDAQLFDSYGEPGVDGTGTVWEYMDSYAFRTDPITATTGWTPGEWTFGGIDVLDANPIPDMIALTTPGTVPLPTPGLLTAGTNQAADGSALSGDMNVLILHTTLDASNATVSVESVDWELAGGGVPGDLLQVGLWVDDGDHAFDAGMDTLSATYMGGGNAATLVFGTAGGNPAVPLDIAAGTGMDVFITYDIMAGAGAQTMSGTLAGATVSGTASTSGFPVNGATFSVGPPPPVATFGNPLAGSLDIPVDTETYVAGAFDVTASEALTILSLVVGSDGASTGLADVTIGLAVDTDANDLYDDGTDTLLATGTLTGFSGTLDLALNDPAGWDLATGTYRLLVTVSIGAGVNDGDTYIVTIESGMPVGAAVLDGLPQTGRTIAIDASLNPVTITSAAPPDGTHGEAYSFTFTVTGGSGSGYTWNISQGVQPTGLSLSTDGMLTGTPTQGAIYTFTVRVVDSFGGEATLEVTVEITSAGGDDDSGCCGMTAAFPGRLGWLWLLVLSVPFVALRRRN